NDTATTEIYTLSLHDALPISVDTDNSSRRTRLCEAPRPPSFNDMPNRRRHLHLAQGLATAALVGHWSEDEIASRFASALHMRSRRPWLKRLVTRIVGRFAPDP